MDQVTKIHLDRQAFTISAEAHTELRHYLEAIRKEVGSKSADVVREVEVRMAELLIERGISVDKVILSQDVDYLKQQLGDPKDFADDDEAGDQPSAGRQRQLFRDTEHGMLAGVSAGLAAFFGIDVVIIRILFIIAVVSGGWGIVVYLALWLLVPEAKTSSEKLQMRGQPVTVENLKAIVDRADVPGAATRAGNTLSRVLATAVDIVLKFTGAVLVFTALSSLFALVAASVYGLTHNGQFFQEDLFPVGTSEILLASIGIGIAALLSMLLLAAGAAMFRRKWPLPVWLTAVVVSLLFVGTAVGAALSADSVPRVRDRFNAAHHTVTRQLPAFSAVSLKEADDAEISYQSADKYAVTFRYIGNEDTKKISTKVVNGTLLINDRDFIDSPECTMLCLFPHHDLEITIQSPNVESLLPRPSLPELPSVTAVPETP